MAAERCGCGHMAEEHEQGTGCLAGWVYDHEGVSISPDGCICEWAHVSSPVRRGGVR